MKVFRRIALVGLLLQIIPCVLTSLGADDKRPFSKIVVFGDSYSDTGHFYELTGNTFPQSPYFEGRASNGILWIEYLADSLGSPLKHEDQFACLGAETGTGNFNNTPEAPPFPGFHQQIQTFISLDNADPSALYVVWVGSYDFFSWLAGDRTEPNEVIESGIRNIVTGITTLLETGAQHVLIVNLPDLGRLPLGQSLGQKFSNELTLASATFNSLLDDALLALGRVQDAQLTRLDAFGILSTLIDEGEAFGLENVSLPAIDNTDSENLDVFLFWDSTHFTTFAHEILADFALQALIESYAQESPTHTSRKRGELTEAAYETSK